MDQWCAPLVNWVGRSSRSETGRRLGPDGGGGKLTDPQQTYREALEELRVRHARLREDEVDIDTLLADVQRASDLLAFCRERLNSVGERLEEVLTDCTPHE